MSARIQDESSNRLPISRTERGDEYRSYAKAVRDMLSGRHADEETIAELAAANADILALKDLRPGDVHQDEILRNLSVMYANDEYIGERLMPVVFTGGSLSGQYFTYNKRDKFAAPDDNMSDRSDPAEVSQGRSKGNYSLTTRALREYLDQMTLQNQSAPLNELVDLQENTLELMALKREQRQATILCTSANYGSNTAAIAAADRWDTASGGDPGAVVDTAMAALWMGRGAAKTVAFTSLDVHNKLKRHPKILDMFKGAGSRPGFATRDMLREYFEVDEYLVGKARQDTANEGQTASYSRIWSNVFGILRVSERPSLRNATFGFTVQDLPTQTDLTFDIQKGAKGAYSQRVSRADQELVVAADTGYLLTTVIG